MSSNTFFITNGKIKTEITARLYDDILQQLNKPEIPISIKKQFAKEEKELYKGIKATIKIPVYDISCDIFVISDDIFSEDIYISVINCKSISGNKILNKLFKDMELYDDIENLTTDFGQAIFNKLNTSKPVQEYRKKLSRFVVKVEKAGLRQGDY